jgi:hypothetical protein
LTIPLLNENVENKLTPRFVTFNPHFVLRSHGLLHFPRFPPFKRAFGVPCRKTLNGNCMAEMTYGNLPPPSVGAGFFYFFT